MTEVQAHGKKRVDVYLIYSGVGWCTQQDSGLGKCHHRSITSTVSASPR
jgi:hypothetical protein